MKIFVLLTLALLTSLSLFAGGPPLDRLVATFSIVARDPATEQMGIAVASRYFSVGAVVPWAEACVGAAATQANVNVGYGPRALELLRHAPPAYQVADRLLAVGKSPGKDGRPSAIAS